ncbi:MAG: SDR family NAD(P)-dependent oxidoreductase [Desulfobacterium sp.]
MFLNGKIALVTGGRAGIGKTIACSLAKKGANLIVTSRQISDKDKVVADIKATGREVLALKANVADNEDCRAAVTQGLDCFGRIDIVVNNAGIYPSAPFLDIEEKEWDEVFAVNLKGPMLMTQWVAKLAMIPQNGGRIINISSCDGKNPTPGIAHYAASKAGLISLTKSMALELAPHNITANAIAPGWVETQTVLQSDRWKTAVKQIPLQRLAKQEEIADAVIFLASDHAGYITGATLDVNGGLIMN